MNLTEVISGTRMHLDTTTTSIAIPLLHPYYVYEYTVAAYTVSVGPYSSVNRVQMPEDGEFIIIIKIVSYTPRFSALREKIVQQ